MNVSRAGIAGLIFALCCFAGMSGAAWAKSAIQTVPVRLVDVGGATVHVAALALEQRVFFVTLKATWCPVCQVQLRRLQEDLVRLRSCGATFVVLAPGPGTSLSRIAERTGFPYPFVEDVDLTIAAAAGLRLAPDQIEPAIFEVNTQGEIVWIDRGRSASRFNDQALRERLDCDARHTA
jgi:peroxiredoxin